MAEFILHHYDTSPFSEKPRVMFGLKGLAWRSVIQPTIMPKPDLVPLTGGYRRAPVMQIGADIYCDSQVILAEILARSGDDGSAAAGGAWAVNLWADRLWFGTTVPVIFGEFGDSVPKAFIEDREKLSGRPFDVGAMKAAAGVMRSQWRAQAAWIDDALAHADFLAGAAPGLADACAYMNIWWLGGAAPGVFEALTAGLDRLAAWRGRVRAIGHGERTEMPPADALAIARASDPAPFDAHDPADPSGLKVGAPVTVAADDYGRDPIAGALVGINRHRVVIARRDPTLGKLNVHFPRVGYVVAAG